VNPAELDGIPGHSRGYDFASVPWGRLAGSPSVWGLCLQWFCHYYGFYFYITWLPTYLQQVRGFDVTHSALGAGLPLAAAGAGSLAGGWAASALARAFGSTARARRTLGFTAYSGAATLLLAFTGVASPTGAVMVMSVSAFAAELSGPISWTAAMDMGGRHVSTLSAFMNMLGQLGGAVAPAIIGWLVSGGVHGWTTAFYVSSAIYGAGALCWLSIDPATPIDRRTC
jgi:predicted MFS family arabinose efflux permease